MAKNTGDAFLKGKIKQFFGIDVRSLVLFRICLSLLLITGIIVTSADLTAHYTDAGVLPREVVKKEYPKAWYLSIHFISGDSFAQSLLLSLAGIFALALLLGFYTRFSTIMSWYLLLSLHIRNPYVLQNGDVLLLLLLFWSMFLPLGVSCSMDSLLNPSRKKIPNQILSWGTVGILLQLIFVYVFTGLLKSSSQWWPDGSAVYYALSVDQFASPFGLFLLKFPSILKFLTYAVYWFEITGPFLLFVPFYFGLIRTIVVFAFFLLQLGMGISLQLGNFPWVASVAMLPFLPSWFWQKTSKIKKFQINAKIFYIFKRINFKFKNSVKSEPLNLDMSGFVNILAILSIIYILLYNLETIEFLKMPNEIKQLGEKLRINQKWNMFAPRPLTGDGWYVIPGKLKDGAVVDLFNDGKPITWVKPDLVSSTYKNYHLRKYMMNLWINRASKHPYYFSQYKCDDWNSRNKDKKQLQELEIVFVLENTLPLYKKPETKNVSIWKHYCFNEKLSRGYQYEYSKSDEGFGI